MAARQKINITPAGMRRTAAAAYCGVSEGHFDKMVAAQLLPQSVPLGTVKLWLREELDDALFALRASPEGEVNTCDQAFGQ